MKKIIVNASVKYEVLIGENLLTSSAERIKAVSNNGAKFAVITDKTVNSIYAEKFSSALKDAGLSVVKYVVKGGEKSKSGKDYLKILEFLAEEKFTRSDCLIALGGGVIGDLTGFVAATYLRGIDFIQVPTTLLAFADSSVGGKTAINLKSGKNLVGAFYQPKLVLCDVDLINTLSASDYASGMAEIIKYGMLFDNEMLKLLDSGMDGKAEEIIWRAVDFKRKVVEEDERDNGSRQLLNFGHTLGHAIEIKSKFKIPHGQAVAIGMKIITERALAKGLCKEEVLIVLIKLLKKYGLYTEKTFDVQKLFEITLVDKKRKSGDITVVLPTSLGKCELKKMSINEWKEFLLN